MAFDWVMSVDQALEVVRRSEKGRQARKVDEERREVKYIIQEDERA